MDISVIRNHLTLGTGKEYDRGTAGVVYDSIWIYLPEGLDLHELLTDFTDPENTSRIVMTTDKGDRVLEGFTQFCGIALDWDGSIKVHLRRPDKKPNEE